MPTRMSAVVTGSAAKSRCGGSACSLHPIRATSVAVGSCCGSWRGDRWRRYRRQRWSGVAGARGEPDAALHGFRRGWLSSTEAGARSSFLAEPHTMLDRTTDSVPPRHPTAADTRQVKALIRAVATELRRHGTPSFNAVSNAWLESQPQSLWPLLNAAVTRQHRPPARRAGDHRHPLATRQPAGADPLPSRLRGHEWARSILDAYQEKVIVLAQADALPESDWFEIGQSSQGRQGGDPTRDGRGAGSGCGARDASRCGRCNAAGSVAPVARTSG